MSLRVTKSIDVGLSMDDVCNYAETLTDLEQHYEKSEFTQQQATRLEKVAEHIRCKAMQQGVGFKKEPGK